MDDDEFEEKLDSDIKLYVKMIEEDNIMKTLLRTKIVKQIVSIRVNYRGTLYYYYLVVDIDHKL